MFIASGDAMRRIDRRSITEFGVSGEQLMENAGKAVVAFLNGEFGGLKGKSVCVLCGKGNNGGDGLVIARLLHGQKLKPAVYHFARKEEAEGSVKLNLSRCEKEKIKVVHLSLSKDLEAEKAKLKDYDVFIDALLGTGFKGAVSGFYQNIIQFVNSLPASVISVDLPSGLNSNNGQVLGACIKADYTVTFGLNKVGLCMYPGVEFAGNVLVKDIGFPCKAVQAEELKTRLLERADAVSLLPARPCDSNKGDFGKVFIAGGSRGMTGAPCLSAVAAMRSGCGLAVVGVPESLSSIVEAKLTEVIVKALPESSAKTL
ncbi:MAG: NAD(P)H-hydrate epimerase, partial [Candidatus Firestonebacteria bacterium]